MHILRYTRTHCGIITRVELGQSYCVCACHVAYEVVDEQDDTQSIVVVEPESP